MVWGSGYASLLPDGGPLALAHWFVDFMLGCLLASVFDFMYVFLC